MRHLSSGGGDRQEKVDPPKKTWAFLGVNFKRLFVDDFAVFWGELHKDEMQSELDGLSEIILILCCQIVLLSMGRCQGGVHFSAASLISGEVSRKLPFANFCFTFLLSLFLNNYVILWHLKTKIILDVTNFRLKLQFF